MLPGAGEEEGTWSTDIGPCIECGGPSWLWRQPDKQVRRPAKAGETGLRASAEGRPTSAPPSSHTSFGAFSKLSQGAAVSKWATEAEGEETSMQAMAKKVDLLTQQLGSCLQGLAEVQQSVAGLPGKVVDEWAEAVENDMRSVSKLSVGKHGLRSFGATGSRAFDVADSTRRSLLSSVEQRRSGQAKMRSTSALEPLHTPQEIGASVPLEVYPPAESKAVEDPRVSVKEQKAPQRSFRSFRSLRSPERSFRSFRSLRSPERSLASLKTLLKPRRDHTVQKMWRFLEEPGSSRAAWVFHIVWVPFIFLTVGATLLQSLSEPPILARPAWTMEVAFAAVFAVELLARIYASPNLMVFLYSFSNTIDVLAALPLIGWLVLGPDALQKVGGLPRTVEERLAQVLVCLSPTLRLLKTLRRFQQYHLFVAILSFTQEALQFLLLALVIIVLLFSSLIYFAEQKVNGDLATLPEAMWLTVVTLTTVGYGDITPQTPAGHLICLVLILGSVLFMAMPIGIIGNAFTEMWKDRDRITMNRRFQDRILQCGYTVQDVVPMFAQFDVDCNGELSLSEFVAMVKEMQLGLQEDSAIQIFEMIDKNGSGGIDCREFVREFFPSTFFHEIYGHGRSPVEFVKEKMKGGREKFAARAFVVRTPGRCRGRAESPALAAEDGHAGAPWKATDSAEAEVRSPKSPKSPNKSQWQQSVLEAGACREPG